jgi:hypothetical protein
LYGGLISAWTVMVLVELAACRGGGFRQISLAWEAASGVAIVASSGE